MLKDLQWDGAKVQETNARDILLAAADLIDTHGLAKGEFEDVEGRLCVHGAIHMAVTGSPQDVGCNSAAIVSEARKLLGDYLRGIGEKPDMRVEFHRRRYDNWSAIWSNRSNTRDVVSALRAAAGDK